MTPLLKVGPFFVKAFTIIDDNILNSSTGIVGDTLNLDIM